MRILVFSWRDPNHPLAGGAEQVMHEHAKGWVKAGHKVTFFTSQLSGLNQEDTLDGIKIFRKGSQYLDVQYQGYLYYRKNKDQFDLIIDQFHGIPFFAPLYTKKPILAVIQETARGVWFLNPFPWPINWLVGLVGFLIEPFIFLFYKRVQFMTGSKSAMDDIIKFGISSNKIKIIPHGVIIKSPQPKPKKEPKFTITFLGALSKDKGVEDAIKTFRELSKYSNNFQFWIIGKGDKNYTQKLINLIKDYGLIKQTKLWGFVSQDKKFELLARSQILLNPSNREGWGLVVIEAASMAVPTVGYNVAGLKDSVKNGQTGLLCQQNTASELSKNILILYKDKNLYERLANNAISWSKQFSWEKSTRESLQLLEKVCKC